MRVERHIEKARRAARRECRRPAGQAFPICTPGFIEMHVCVDRSREHVQSVRVHLLARASFQAGRDRYDMAILDGNIRSSRSTWGDDRAIANQQVIQAHLFISSPPGQAAL